MIIATEEQRNKMLAKIRSAKAIISEDKELMVHLYEWSCWLDSLEPLLQDENETTNDALLTAIAVGFSEGIAYKHKKH